MPSTSLREPERSERPPINQRRDGKNCPRHDKLLVVKLKKHKDMSTQNTGGGVIEPYLFFGGKCEEAVAFYKKALGAEVLMMMRYKDSPEPHPEGMLPPGFENKVMHTTLRIGKSNVMASDGCGESASFAGFSLSIAVQTEAEADRAFAALSEGGSVMMPLAKTFWSPKFGMLTDKFGVGWMVSVWADHGKA
jgi:PhnB protein